MNEIVIGNISKNRRHNSSRPFYFGFCFSCLLLLAAPVLFGQVRLYPSNWWVGMKHPELQVMVRGKDIGKGAPSVSLDRPVQGVRLLRVHPAESPDYLFLDLYITPQARQGTVGIRIAYSDQRSPVRVDLPLLARRAGNGTSFAQGVRSEDFIYFLMPDRFSNGDPANDRVAGMKDQSLDRDSIFLRHGGDMQGVIDHLDYLQGLGVTTLWMTPVLENDMPHRTEHGYAFTDHYTIDPRLGGAATYKRLSDSLHRRGMKLIQDAVYNHVGLYHFLIQDPPFRDWVHQWPKFMQTSYREQPLMDPYGAAIDRKVSSDGWFTTEMPDLNQGNPYVANFLINHAIWCVETFGVDGWRIDTYFYNDLTFMNRCNKALTDEYPRMTMFGETFVHGMVNQAFFVDNRLETTFKSNLQGATDFQCNFNGIVPALTEKPDWSDGIYKLYNTLSQDFLYKDPMRNVLFLDNHDMSRFFSQVGESIPKQKIGLEWLLTCRGIPQLYYGTEILMKGFANPDGLVRLDFPGGWAGDSKNAFTGAGMSEDELSVQRLVRILGNYRKHSSALQKGRMMQFLPQDQVYVYFRYDEQQTIMCIMNTADTTRTIDPVRFSERIGGFKDGVDVVTGVHHSLTGPIRLPPLEMWVMELQ